MSQDLASIGLDRIGRVRLTNTSISVRCVHMLQVIAGAPVHIAGAGRCTGRSISRTTSRCLRHDRTPIDSLFPTIYIKI